MTGEFLLINLCSLMCLYGTKAIATHSTTHHDDPDMYRNVSGLITSQGYPLEEHSVQTADGYTLSLLRIPHGRNSKLRKVDKDVVLFIHGILGDASSWVINLPDKSLGFVVPDAGYDAWFINMRGCTYSKKHVKYNTDQYEFWNFSIDDIAQYDVPATIDYVLKATGKKDLFIIATSQGTTEMFALLSEMPEYNEKVKLLIAIAPVGWVGHVPPLYTFLSNIVPMLNFMYKMISAGEMLSNDMFKSMRMKFCSSDAAEICKDLTMFLVGKQDDSIPLNETRVGVYYTHYPAGTSSKVLTQYAQLKKSKKFRKYDYGRLVNLKYYNQEEPPDYNVSLITTPVALFWSKNDVIGNKEDADILRRNLNSIVFDYCVPSPYNHLDYFIALNAPEVFNKPLMDILSQYSNTRL